jgi:molybdopterin converting factor small subunit
LFDYEMELSMKITLRCFAMLSDAAACSHGEGTEHPISPGETVGSLLQRLEIPRERVEHIFLNGRQVDTEAALSDGDRLAVAPAVYGM